jgi:hypothetical protein
MKPAIKIRQRVGLLLVAAVTFFATGRPGLASAQANPPIYVPSDNVNALIDAIHDANFYPGPDTIILEGGSYVLDTPNNTVGSDANGLPQIMSTIAIQGNGAIIARLTDAPDAFRLFYIDPGGDLTLENVTVAFGKAQQGGGIYNAGGTLNLIGSTLSHNQATGSGSGIYNDGGTLNLIGSTIEENWGAASGGGIYTEVGSLTITDSMLRHNQAHGGGGIYSTSSTLSLNSSTIQENWADDETGGIFLEGGSVTARCTSFLDNVYGLWIEYPDSMPDVRYNWWGSADGPSGEETGSGDGLFVNVGVYGFETYRSFLKTPSCILVPPGDVNALRNAIYTANAGPGLVSIVLAPGGDYMLVDKYDGTVPTDANGLPRITGAVTIYGDGADIWHPNHEYGYDFAIDPLMYTSFRIFHVDPGGDLTLENVTVAGGEAELGGGIYNAGALTLINSTIEGNEADISGAGIYSTGTLTIRNSTISNNDLFLELSPGEIGAGIYNGSGTLSVNNSTISSNYAPQGGGIYSDGGSTSVHCTSFVNNGEDLRVENVTGTQDVRHNWWGSADGPSGEGSGSGDAVSGDVVFKPFLTTEGSCTVVPAGDPQELVNGIDWANFFPDDPHTIILEPGDYALGRQYGGGSNGLPEITSDITILGYGSTILREPGTPPFRIFYVEGSGDLRLEGVTVAGGEADYGGGIYNDSGTLAVVASRLENNQASMAGDGIFADGGSTSVNCTSFVNNGEGLHVWNVTQAQDMRHNWWGSPDGPAGDGAGSGDSVYGDASFVPFLTSETAPYCTALGDGDTYALAEAIEAANVRDGLDVLFLSPGATYELADPISTVEGPGGLPSITSEITILGNGADIRRGLDAPDFRVFFVDDAGKLTLDDVTVSNGIAPEGAGVLNLGTLVVANSRVQFNSANTAGGGIANAGMLTVLNSTITGNQAAVGGGIYAVDGSTTVNCTHIVNNELEGLRVESAANADLRYNWWGGADGPSGDGPGSGDSVFGNFDATPFLTASDGCIPVVSGDTIELDSAISSVMAEPEKEVILLAHRGIYPLDEWYTGPATAGRTALPAITGEVTILGSGSTIQRAASASEGFRLFYIGTNGDLTLENVTVRGGASDSGGGLYNDAGQLVLIGSTISDNQAGGSGGGIYNTGTLTLSRSSVSGNEAQLDYGGGICSAAGSLSVTESRIEQNSALMDEHGDGVYVSGGSATLHCTNFERNGEALWVDDYLAPQDARFNWWGSPDGPSGVGTGSGEGIYGSVDFLPFLSSPHTVGTNSPPFAADDAYSVAEDGTLMVDAPGLLTSDVDCQGDQLTVSGVASPPENGSLEWLPDGSFEYTPADDFHGTDSFTYTVDDGHGGTDTATVTITVNPANDPPDAVNDAASTDEDTQVTIDVAANDTAGPLNEDQTLTVTEVSSPGHGTATVNPDGSVTYTPQQDYNGPDTFTYTVCDSGDVCDTATVSITINAANDPPVATDDSATTYEDDAVTIGVLANDSDVEGDTLTLASVANGGNGTVTSGDTNVTYTPDPDFCGEDSFTYIVTDGNGGIASAMIYVTVICVNDPPLATDNTAETNEDAPITIDVLANDSDVDGGALTIQSVTQGNHGSVANDGTVATYTPNADWNGVDTFTYTVDDGYGGTDTATVTITVHPVNDPPDAVDDSDITLEDTVVDVSVLANDSDPEGDTFSIGSVTDPAHGTVTRNSDNTLKYTPSAGWFGVDSFAYTVCDSDGLCSDATVTVTVLHPDYEINLTCANSPVPQEGPAFYTLTFMNTGQVDLDVAADPEIPTFSLPVNGSADFMIEMSGPFSGQTEVVGQVNATATLDDAFGSTNTYKRSAEAICTIGSRVNVLKLTNGSVDPSQDWTFNLYHGPNGYGGQAIASDSSYDDQDGILDFSNPNLDPAHTYSMCQLEVPSGWSSQWKIDTDADGIPDTIVVAYNPNASDDPPQDVGNRCFDFGDATAYALTPGGTLAFEVDSAYPGGDPRTPGYWKNWNTCTGGNQAETAAKNGGPDEGWFILDDVLNDPGISWGGFTIGICEDGVSILDQRDLRTDKKKASDAAFTLAMHLLAAQLNFAAGAETCQTALDVALEAENLLVNLGFDGTGNYLRPNEPEYGRAIDLASELDEYNNGYLCNP